MSSPGKRGRPAMSSSCVTGPPMSCSATSPWTTRFPSYGTITRKSSWTVTGILESRGSPFDSEIWAKREEVGHYFGKDNVEQNQSFYTTIVVTTRDQVAAEKFARDLPGRTQVKINAVPERKYYQELSK